MKTPDYSFKFWIKARRLKARWPTAYSYFRNANCGRVFFLWFEIEFGLPYLKEYIYGQGYDNGFTAGFYAREEREKIQSN